LRRRAPHLPVPGSGVAIHGASIRRPVVAVIEAPGGICMYVIYHDKIRG
jgi:hypothetical protein